MKECVPVVKFKSLLSYPYPDHSWKYMCEDCYHESINFWNETYYAKKTIE